MDALFAAIEQTSLSAWMREDSHAYFVALIFHAFGMAMLVGGGIVICLRGLGVGQGAAMQSFRGFLLVMWLGAALLLPPILRSEASTRRHRWIAALALALWLAGVAAGKLLLHTYTVLTVT